MSIHPNDKKAQLITRLMEQIHQRLPAAAAEAAAAFARQYYAWVAPDALLDDDPEDLYGAVLAHWDFARQRRPQTASVRVYNPDFEGYGWQSTHTAIEIVTDDMPFLVNSVTMALNRLGLTVHRVIHPVMRVVRDAAGELQAMLPADSPDGIAESVMHYQVDRQTEVTVFTRLLQDLQRTLADVRAAVEDWQPMRARLLAIVNELDAAPPPLPPENIPEAKAFLDWVAGGHFTFLGFREYELLENNGRTMLRSLGGSGLGLLRDDGSSHLSTGFLELPPEVQRHAWDPELLILAKSTTRSTVHRPAYLDHLGIKRFDADGRVCGERRFLGLYSSLAYSVNPRTIPLLGRKIQRVMARAGLAPGGHDGKALQNILDTYPRDELFQIGEDELLDTALGILHLQERQRLRLFVRGDAFGRFVSCLVYVPRDRYDTALRLRMQAILLQAFNGIAVESTTQFLESVLARVLFYIRLQPGQRIDYSLPELETRLREAMLSWEDELQRALFAQCGEAQGNALFRRYQTAFPPGYRDDFHARTAVYDIQYLESLSAEQPLGMHLYRRLEDPEGQLRFKLYGAQPLPLSDVLPVLEKLGLRVLQARPYAIERADVPFWIIEFDLRDAGDAAVDVEQVRDIFQDAFAAVWRGDMENDGFNQLVLGAGLGWRNVVMLRACCRYLLQTRVPFSQAYMEHTLARHADIARLLVELFHARFDPDHEDHGRRCTRLIVAIEDALEQVSNLDEDRILRRFLNIIQATLRTNFYQRDAGGRPKPWLSCKLDSGQIDDLPRPRPLYEIFVYSPRVEAVHLRGGPVARGGLRWSDRREDFRTEVLGLMKAQMVKNAVIVPVGAKGGFVVKRPPAGREALQVEVVACYETFIRGLLDLTDNRVGDSVIAPMRVLRYDRDDPYLVVAADKGTASFSDIANRIAGEYGFWLGDAFASGGSAGYDHKKMGITARGGWESVKRHFRELGLDVQNRDSITVLGIGDMSGDVFGNGLLQSQRVKLVAAFNHQNIFIDPDPNPETSYQERERLFQLPRSTWDDYNPELLSAGGGIYPRTAKSIQISPPARAVLGLKSEHYTPNDLIRALLQAPVDLLWNGGIGTYVKASGETHADVGDKANDAVRVNGKDLQCKVVGEGGNLGFTQLGRIEYARHGGRMLTDAIDNSGGVNCSDHEVNIKILLDRVVGNGDLTVKQRNQLLTDMTAEVAALVLRQNYLQPEAVSLMRAAGPGALGDQVRLMRSLERAGRLDRALEFLPNDEELAVREANKEGLTAPELAVLLSYAKIMVYQELLASDVPEDPYLKNDLRAYFPTPLRERYGADMENHPLRREIITTYITNSLINRMGSTFPYRLWEETGAGCPDIARAYTAAREIFAARELWHAIEALDNQAPAALQLDLLARSQRLLERATLWLLRHRRPPLAIAAVVEQFGPGIATLRAHLPELLQPAERTELEAAWVLCNGAGVPVELEQWVTGLDALYSGLDLVEVANQAGLPVPAVATVYFELAGRLELSWLRRRIGELQTAGHWQDRARAALLNGLYEQARVLTSAVLQSAAEVEPERRLARWLEQHRAGVERCRALFAELKAAGRPDLAMLSVALRETADLGAGEG